MEKESPVVVKVEAAASNGNKKGSSAWIIVILIIAILLVCCVVTVLAGAFFYSNNKSLNWNSANPFASNNPFITQTEKLTQTPVITATPEANPNGLTYPGAQMSRKLTPGYKNMSSMDSLDLNAIYYAKYIDAEIIFVYVATDAQPTGSFEEIKYVKYTKSNGDEYIDPEYFAESQVSNIVKLSDINIAASDSHSPVSLVDSIKSADGYNLYVSYITGIYTTSDVVESGILRYDLSDHKFLSFVQHNVEDAPVNEMTGAFTFAQAENQYVIASLGECYACTVINEATFAINFYTSQYVVLGGKVADVTINSTSVTYTEMNYAGEESNECPDSCPIFEPGQTKNVLLP